MYLQQPTRFVGLISRSKLSDAGRHAGVLLPDGKVAHMTPEGATIVTFNDFAQGRSVQLDKAAPVDFHHQLHWRAHQSVGRMPPYDLLNRNCEHYATWLMGEEPKSPQVTGAVVLGLIGTFLWLAK
jgi:Lecithin retinol acyltransferase